MQRMFAAVLLSMAMVGVCEAKDFNLKLDGENTKIEWTGSKPDGKHSGGFKKLNGQATKVGNELKLEVEIDCASLHSDNEMLTQHLKSPDFFAVKDHPKAKFKSTKIEKTAEGYKVIGDLTLLGKTRQISFPAKIEDGGELKIDAKFMVNRMEFGMTYGKGKVNDEVELRVHVAAK